MSDAKDNCIDVPAGTALLKQGQSGGSMYIIDSGQIDLIQKTVGGDVVTATLGPGECFGEAALLENATHSDTALANGPSRLLRIDPSAFADMIEHNPQIGVCLIRMFVANQHRIRQRLDEILNALAKSVPVPPEPAPHVASPPASSVPEPEFEPEPEPVAAPPRVGIALRVTSVDQVLLLDPQRDDFLIGRPDPASGTQPEIDLGPYNDAGTLSRRHARILRKEHAYFLCEETATTNGTFINGQRLKTGAAVPLKPGDKLRFGSIEIEVIGA
ncbi:MAG: cyclic nucleotide-binding domain-containing protein [Rudaea sp.]